MNWNKKQQGILEHSELMMQTLHDIIAKESEWLFHVRENFDPDNLSDELAKRLSKLMWQTAMMWPVLSSDSAGEAFDRLARWVQELNPTGVFIEQLEDEEEFDEIVLASTKVRMERERGSEDE